MSAIFSSHFPFLHLQFLQETEAMVLENRVPHAILLSGSIGRGGLLYALRLAQMLLDAKNESTLILNRFEHPDLHFIFPTNTNQQVKKEAQSALFLPQWRGFLQKKPFAEYMDWLQTMEVETKQATINVRDAEEIGHQAQLRPYMAQAKVFILWMAEKMNPQTANKLLKIIEEPPENTYFFLLAENEKELLPTILSRCRSLVVPPLPQEDIAQWLEQQQNIAPETAEQVAQWAEGNLNLALQQATAHETLPELDNAFAQWMRILYQLNHKDKLFLFAPLIAWCDAMAAKNREMQKEFLLLSVRHLSSALAITYEFKHNSSAFFGEPANFIEKFAPFIHGKNIEPMVALLEEALYHVERNANVKIMLLDLSIKLSKLLRITE